MLGLRRWWKVKNMQRKVEELSRKREAEEAEKKESACGCCGIEGERKAAAGETLAGRPEPQLLSAEGWDDSAVLD